MDTQATIARFNAAAQSTQKGIADCQVAEGYLNEVTNILIRKAELAVSAPGGTEDLALDARLTQIDGMGVLKDISATVDDAGGSVSTKSASWTVTGLTDADLGTVAAMRADLGATANVLQGALGTIQTAITNNSAVVSSIQDVDVAEETSKLARQQVLAQAGVSVLAQANQLP